MLLPMNSKREEHMKLRSLPPTFKNDDYEVREAASTMDPLTPNRVAFPGLADVACRNLWKAGSVTTYTLPFTPYHRAFSSVAGFGGPKLTWLRQKASSLKARLARRPSRSRTLCPPATSGSKHLERNFHREGFNPATGSPTATLLRLHPSRRPHRGETYSQGVMGGVYRARHMCGPAYKGHANLTSSPPSSSISLAVLPHTRKERAQALKGAGYLLTDATTMYLHSISSAVYSRSISCEAGKVKGQIFERQWWMWLGMASVRQLLAEGEEREEALPTVEGQAKALAEG
ncbi:hypothetical protein Tco_1093321 [Tanacetum coccineum]|uniref:Uncharacterized protein n=1 Tax=Tanacetum coccineum TaxID=301880 RepID=A0ABQ5ICC5_9ASTR